MWTKAKYCSSGNIALKKPTKQLGITSGLGSDLAVDGNTDPDSDHGSCAHPYSGYDGLPVWWYVDLGQSYRITQIILYNRAHVDAASKYYQMV